MEKMKKMFFKCRIWKRFSNSDFTLRPFQIEPKCDIPISFQFRVHCQNVFEQILTVKDKIDSLNSSYITYGNESVVPDLNLTMIRYNKLAEIFQTSGCQTQACTSLLAMMPDVRNNSDSVMADSAVMKLASIKYVLFL